MKFPNKVRVFCPYCKKHTEHTVELAKKKSKSPMAEGERRFHRKMLGYGSFPKEHPRGREKPTKKVDIRYKCTVCGKKHMRGAGFRVKKFELVKV